MALAISSGSAALLLAYCVTGLSLWTINNGMAGRGAPARVVGAAAHARTSDLANKATPIVSRPLPAQIQPWQSATDVGTSSDAALGKREELRELRRRAVMAFTVITLLKGSATNLE